MAYIYTWNSTFEGKPADIDNISDGATEIRKFKVAVRERFAKDHYFDTAGTDANHGEHSKVTLREQSGKPLAEVNKGYLYTKEVSGKAELFWEDEDGNELQLTSGGSPSSSVQFPSGTKMVFYQDTAPTGWTIQNTLDDKLLYVTKGSAAGGQTGGGVHSSGTWSWAGINTASHTLTAAESGAAAHTHTFVLHAGSRNHEATEPGQLGTRKVSDDEGGVAAYNVTTNASSGSAASAGHSHALSGSSWRPAAYCVIIAAKV
ncbi:MAG: hypothetical protein BWY21_01800 [Parcubacteria group bacterium ADurb.Bin216]|nr:MAG: hypothetical protein BWY21_01800 [Parcubacteria group bacterium ADurb.Bin216]